MDKKRAIELLIQAVDEIPYLKTLHFNNDEFPLWHKKVEDIIRAGLEPDDNSKYWSASQSLEILRGVYEDNIYQQEYIRKITNYEIALKSIVLKYEILGIIEKPEKKTDTSYTIQYPVQLFDAMQFHPEVIGASRSCFVSGNYREAILNAFIRFIDYVKEITGLDLDGDDLMNQVFSFNYDKKQRRITKYPIIRINELKNNSDRDEQQGFMFLCKGAAGGIRNPKAHKLILQSNPLHTLEYLAFASLLIRRVEEGKVAQKSTRKPKLDEETFIARCVEGGHQNSILLYSKIKDLLNLRSENGDFINWGVSGYSYRLPWKGHQGGEVIFVGYGDGGLTLWLYIVEKGGRAGQRYLEDLQNISILTQKMKDYKKHKEPYFSIDKITTSDIDAFLSAVENLGLALETEVIESFGESEK